MLSFVFNEHTYPACDVTICAEIAIHILQIFANNIKLKEIVCCSSRPIGLFFHALSVRRIKIK